MSKFNFVVIILQLFFFQIIFGQVDFNTLDANQKKHGLWKGYYPESKRLRYEGTFDHGKETGVFNYFDDTKAQSLIATREFNTKENSAYTIIYDQKKNKVSEGKVIDRLYEGVWLFYHQASNIIMTQENYKKGKLDGLRSVFYPNAKIAEETNYSNGIKNGNYNKYSEKGVILESSKYVNGEFDGLAVYKDPLGNTVAQGKYVDGKKKGIWQFFENGKLVNEENMSKVKKRVKPKSK